MLKKALRSLYTWGARSLMRFGPATQIYLIWANLYAFIYVDRATRRYQPEIYDDEDIHIPLERVLKLPYVPDGKRELGDVCLPPGVIENRIRAMECGEDYDTDGPMDCDDYARYLANSIGEQHSPMLLSVIAVKDSELKWGWKPSFPGHMVCVWAEPHNGTSKIYHVGNWNRRSNGYRHERHYAYDSLADCVNDLAQSMAGDPGKLLVWILHDKDLKVCDWGVGDTRDIEEIDGNTLSQFRPWGFILGKRK